MTISFVQGAKASMTTGASGKQEASVLLIEDEPDLAHEVRLELEAAGHSVKVANSVEEGLRAARSGWATVHIPLHGIEFSRALAFAVWG